MKIIILFLTLRVLSNALKNRDYDVYVMSKYIIFSIMLYGIITGDSGTILETSFMLIGASINK